MTGFFFVFQRTYRGATLLSFSLEHRKLAMLFGVAVPDPHPQPEPQPPKAFFNIFYLNTLTLLSLIKKSVSYTETNSKIMVFI